MSYFNALRNRIASVPDNVLPLIAASIAAALLVAIGNGVIRLW